MYQVEVEPPEQQRSPRPKLARVHNLHAGEGAARKFHSPLAWYKRRPVLTKYVRPTGMQIKDVEQHWCWRLRPSAAALALQRRREMLAQVQPQPAQKGDQEVKNVVGVLPVPEDRFQDRCRPGQVLQESPLFVGQGHNLHRAMPPDALLLDCILNSIVAGTVVS